MSRHHHSKVNSLVNPVSSGDTIIAESGEVYEVQSNMRGERWLVHVMSGKALTHPVSGQMEICRQIADLVNV